MSDLKAGSNLEKVLRAGHFAFTGECGPPQGANVEHLIEKGNHLKGVVDSVNVTDNQTAVVRMSSWAASLILLQQGIEPNFQMVCRDRNRLAIQSDILGSTPWAFETCSAFRATTSPSETIPRAKTFTTSIPCS
jgi:methylenetetrahydrofolate reductase (NADPH)